MRRPGRQAVRLLRQFLLPVRRRFQRLRPQLRRRPATSGTTACVNYGVAICKYTGSRGKGGASDASAEADGSCPLHAGQGRRHLADRDAGQGGSGRRRHRGGLHGQPEHCHRGRRRAGARVCTRRWSWSPSWTATKPCWPARRFIWHKIKKLPLFEGASCMYETRIPVRCRRSGVPPWGEAPGASCCPAQPG